MKTFLLVLALVAGPAFAQGYPAKPIRYVVPFQPGGTTDILGRLVAAHLQEAWKQPVVVDNRPGAGGAVGAEMTAKASPDGYTIMGGTISTHAINASVYDKLPYDPVKDFAPVTLLATQPNMLVVHPSVPAQNVRELIALLKASPDKYTYSTSGNGTSAHLSGELFKSMTGTRMQHVPYKGSPAAIADAVGGQVSMSFDNISTAYPQAKAGKLRALAVTTAKRSGLAPEVPTFAESGLPGYELGSWHGVFAPAGTPKDIVAKLNAEIVRGIQSAAVREKLAALGVEAVGTSVDSFADFVRAEVPKWAKVVKESGAKAE
jgi:tripartite-type tricarboxylate transporter receptor subunit TctC